MSPLKSVPSRIFKFWPLLSIPITALSVDLFVIPTLRARTLVNLTVKNLFFLAVLLGTAELVYWFFFWRKTAQFVAAGNRASYKPGDSWPKKQSLKIWIGASRKYDRFMKSRWMRWVERGSYPVALLLSIFFPFGGRIIGLIFYGSRDSKVGLAVVATGNIVHIAMVVIGWNALFNWLGW